ncbi:uncharacterized protein LOC131852804 [Achroia grisella]|uniref:uncharacterized protein LOC131852804 n=1 Tax=Achroia grisella TaxID=688607 RepID=UPI0027D30A3D|nr:uncharacterized protein LOC131852804 [Achroia grisella]
MARVRSLDTRPLRCYRCLLTGHVGQRCTAKENRGGACFRCGQDGHKAATCMPLRRIARIVRRRRGRRTTKLGAPKGAVRLNRRREWRRWRPSPARHLPPRASRQPMRGRRLSPKAV